MRILFAGLKYDYGIPERGLSFEYYNFFDSLIGMGHETELFDFYSLYLKLGSEEMTRCLRERVDEWKPDLLFTFLYGNEFDRNGLKAIKHETRTVTFNWFADDHWRFENFSRHWADCFSFVSTTDAQAVGKYRNLGFDRVLLTQWAANPRYYKKGSGVQDEGITFVGQAHGDRPAIIRALRRRGISVKVYGTGWKTRRWHDYARRLRILSRRSYEKLVNSTRIPQEEMIRHFQRSRINLNLSASSQMIHNQIKGRNFEIPACEGFQISGPADRIEEYFVPDREIVLYKSVDHLVEIIRYYLENEEQRAAVASASYERVIKEHTYEHRFRELFRQMDLA
jgi:spore maturation protein CgeB